MEPTDADRALAEQMKQGLLPTRIATERAPILIKLGLLPPDFVLPPPVSPEWESKESMIAHLRKEGFLPPAKPEGEDQP